MRKRISGVENQLVERGDPAAARHTRHDRGIGTDTGDVFDPGVECRPDQRLVPQQLTLLDLAAGMQDRQTRRSALAARGPIYAARPGETMTALLERSMSAPSMSVSRNSGPVNAVWVIPGMSGLTGC